MIVCVLFPRFVLSVTARRRQGLLGIPAALAPEPGGPRQVGEATPAAEAFGVKAGMRLGEAMARCPQLTLIPPDPAGVSDAWERLLARLEAIGAAVEPERPGLACFAAEGLLRLHHGLSGVLEAARRAAAAPVRLGVAPSRFAAVAAATRARPRRPEVVAPSSWAALGGARPDTWQLRQRTRVYLAPLPVALLRARPALAELPEALERLGVKTLGELAELPPAALADRFGRLGLLAHELATGGDLPLRPRTAVEGLREELELPEALSGLQLERALEILVERLLARRERRGRMLRSVTISAVLVEGAGTWHERVTFREALAAPARIRLALAPRLSLIPSPADVLRLAVEEFGPPAAGQRPLLGDPAEARRGRLGEAIRQARAAAGADAALRVLEIDPASRLPERRAVLIPFEG